MKFVSVEMQNKFDEFAKKEFASEEKKRFNRNHLKSVIFSSVSITYIVYVITMHFLN